MRITDPHRAVNAFHKRAAQDAPRYAAACEDCPWQIRETADEAAIRAAVAGHAKRREHQSFYVVLHTTNQETN